MMHRIADARPEDATTDRPMTLAALGLVAGLGSGFLGIGGGLILVPGLVLLFSCPIKRAVGVSLATIVVVSLVAVLVELALKGVNLYWTMALALTVGSFVGSTAGARLMPHLPERTLRVLFAVCLLLASYRMLTCSHTGADGSLTALGAGSPFVALPIGVLGGLTSTLFGIGGGVVTVPCLSLFFRDIPFHAARATSLATILPTSTLGAYHHHRLGNVDLAMVRRLIPTALAGAIAGVALANFLPPGPCRTAFALFLVLVALRLLVIGRAAVPKAVPQPIPQRSAA